MHCSGLGLSALQIDIWELRRRNTSYERIKQIHPKLGPHNITIMTCLRRTALRLYWDLKFAGGNDGYLSETDEARLVEICQEQAAEFHPMTTFDVCVLAKALKEERQRTAKLELKSMSCPFMAAKIETEAKPPSRPWVNDLCQRHGIQLASRREIEQSRLRAGQFDDLKSFLDSIKGTLEDVPDPLLFNADETMLSAKRAYKCLAGDDNPGALAVAPQRKQHITAMVTVSYVGERIPMFLVLSNLRDLPASLARFSSRAWFGASSNGWMTRFLFLDWAICFCHWLEGYRSRLGGSFLSAPAALILDGHTTRLNPAALWYFRLHNVRVIILPAHSSHITQPFDVGIATSFKNEFKRALSRLFSQFDEPTADELRFVSILAAIEAHDNAVSILSAMGAFRRAGLRPLDPDELLNSTYVIRDPIPGLQRAPSRGFSISGKVITEEIAEQLMTYLRERGRRPPNEETMVVPINLLALANRAMRRDLSEGQMFSPYPPNLIPQLPLPGPNPYPPMCLRRFPRRLG